MKTPKISILLAGLVSLFVLPAKQMAAVVLQGSGSSYVSFEAETKAIVVNGTQTYWVSTNDSSASGGSALYIEGTTANGTAPHSFVQYQIKFATAGIYNLYYRLRADAGRTVADQFTGNSCFIPNTLGAFSTPGDQTNLHVGQSNTGTQAPGDNVYDWQLEPDPTTYTVSQAQVDAGIPLIFTIGTREAGFMLDRFILSTDATLTDAALDATANSDTSIVAQGGSDAFVAFEAETKGTFINGTQTFWVSTNDATASASGALYIEGTTANGTAPHSFVQYQIKFSQPGSYRLYYRWRADAARTVADQFTGNSCFIPNKLGAFSTPGDQINLHVGQSNTGTQAPGDNVYDWQLEPDTATYTVSQSDVDAGVPLVFSVGTREAGFMIDRFVFSPDATLTDAALDALPNSGAKVLGPEIAKAVSSATLDTVLVTFTRALDPATVSAGKFTLNGVQVNSATIDADDARKVHLTTSAQTQGTVYTLTVNNVSDTSGNAIAANSHLNFTAWKLVSGWATTEIYLNITGTTVDDLKNAPAYQARIPDEIRWVKGFQLNNDPRSPNMGAQISALFSPQVSEAYNFYVNNDNEAELLLSSDQTEAGLQSLGVFPLSPPVFDDAIVAQSSSLSASQKYLLVGLVKSDGGDVYLNVAAQPSTSATPAASLPVLGGSSISTFVNPDLGNVTFTQQPVSVTTTVGGRASFSVKANATEAPVYYQWRVNGTDIPGATRPVYVTPVLASGDSAKTYTVVVSVAGKDTVSSGATLTVNPGQPSNLQPYIGINFVGGGDQLPGPLTPVDVAGAVLQENWNNLTGFQFDQAALVDASGAPTPVTLSAQATEHWYSGTIGAGSANGVMLQGFIDTAAATDPFPITLNNIPAGNYDVIVYSVGFPFQATYLEGFELTGGGTYPTYHVNAESGLQFNANPAFRRMSSTDPANRASGNYVQFDNVTPAADGSLVISTTWESTEAGNGHQPAVNGIQLVKVNPVSAQPTVVAIRQGSTLVISWDAAAVGFTLESSAALGTAASWTPVTGTPNPITAAGTANISTSGQAGFYRLRK